MKNHKLFTFKQECKDLMKGTEEISLDSEYVFLPNRLLNGKPTWIGTMDSIIKWNESESCWKLCDIFKNECYAKLHLEYTFPIGKNGWNLLPEIVCKNDKTKVNLDFMLSTCKDGEFSCNDGTGCIDINKKCKIINDCACISQMKPSALF